MSKASLKKDTKKIVQGTWGKAKGFVVAGLIMSVIVFAAMTCSAASLPQIGRQTSTGAKTLPKAKTSDYNHWKYHLLFNSFTVAIPVTVELQTKNSPYGRQMTSLGYSQLRDDVVIFNQKGLCNLSQKAQNQYCRIMFSYLEGSYGDFLRRNETEVFDWEWDQLLREMVASEIGTNSRLIGSINREWVRINNANAIMVTYKRTGNNFDYTIPVVCKILLFQDNNKFVKMMLSYREKEANLWEKDFEQVLRSFEWKN